MLDVAAMGKLPFLCKGQPGSSSPRPFLLGLGRHGVGTKPSFREVRKTPAHTYP
jgi:hypothetical protein